MQIWQTQLLSSCIKNTHIVHTAHVQCHCRWLSTQLIKNRFWRRKCWKVDAAWSALVTLLQKVWIYTSEASHRGDVTSLITKQKWGVIALKCVNARCFWVVRTLVDLWPQIYHWSANFNAFPKSGKDTGSLAHSPAEKNLENRWKHPTLKHIFWPRIKWTRRRSCFHSAAIRADNEAHRATTSQSVQPAMCALTVRLIRVNTRWSGVKAFSRWAPHGYCPF